MQQSQYRTWNAFSMNGVTVNGDTYTDAVNAYWGRRIAAVCLDCRRLGRKSAEYCEGDETRIIGCPKKVKRD